MTFRPIYLVVGLILAGYAMILAGIWLLIGLGWMLIVAGILAAAAGVALYDPAAEGKTVGGKTIRHPRP